MRNNIVKLFETGLAKIQKNSTENTLVLKKVGVDKSVFFPSPLTSPMNWLLDATC